MRSFRVPVLAWVVVRHSVMVVMTHVRVVVIVATPRGWRDDSVSNWASMRTPADVAPALL